MLVLHIVTVTVSLPKGQSDRWTDARPLHYAFHQTRPVSQGVALTGCNTTGPPSRAFPWWVKLHMWVLQTTTDASDRN